MNPTVLSPWYVVKRVADMPFKHGNNVIDNFEWYIAQDGDEDPWSYDRKKAMLFNSLHSAHRVARASGAEVVVVVDETDLAEYRRV